MNTCQEKPVQSAEDINKIEKKINAEIARRNKLFKGATKAEKRVLIAKDVITQVRAGKFKPTSGTYVASYEISKIVDEADQVDEVFSLQKEFLKPEVRCQVCGLGSLMVSCTIFNNKETSDDWYTDFYDLGHTIEVRGVLKNKFLNIFSKSQLDLIEMAFEGYDSSSYSAIDQNNKLVEAVLAFHEKYSNSKDRLVGIMRNIIKNNGLFIP